MSTPSLRGLAKAYSDGLIDRKQYIRARRQIIDNIVGGKVEIVPYEAPAARPNPDLERTFSDGEATLEVPPFDVDAPPSTAAKSNLTIVIIAVLALTAVGGFTWLKMAPSPNGPARREPATSENKDPRSPNPAEELLVDFLDENRWQIERIDAFVLAWEKAPAAARRALADSPSMHRAAAAIYQKFGEEKALLDLGEYAEVLATQRRLLDLAAALSLHNERIARLEDEWLETRARVRASDDPSAEQDAPAARSAAPAKDDAAQPTLPEAPTAMNDDTPGSDPPLAAADEAPAADPPMAQASAAAATTASAPIATAPVVIAEAPVSDAGESAATAPPDLPAPSGGAVAAAGDASTLDTGQPQVKRPATKQSGCRAALAKQRRPYCRDSFTDKLNGPALVVLPGGRAEIGGPKSEEQPRRTVTIEQPFALGIYETSYKEFQAFCAATERACPRQPWALDPDLPVVNVPWTLATEYTRWLSEMSGATYRLPSEAEWEYAARGGTTTVYPFGDEVLPTHARFSFRGIQKNPLASKDRSVNRNKFRLYHMIGNVREWVLDVWHENHAGAPSDGGARQGNSDQRVVRGGSFADGADRIRSASRMHLAAQAGDDRTGFRVLRELN
jgi:formylglycine-generating enzyme required for sulfatase activity